MGTEGGEQGGRPLRDSFYSPHALSAGRVTSSPLIGASRNSSGPSQSLLNRKSIQHVNSTQMTSPVASSTTGDVSQSAQQRPFFSAPVQLAASFSPTPAANLQMDAPTGRGSLGPGDSSAQDVFLLNYLADPSSSALAMRASGSQKSQVLYLDEDDVAAKLAIAMHDNRSSVGLSQRHCLDGSHLSDSLIWQHASAALSGRDVSGLMRSSHSCSS